MNTALDLPAASPIGNSEARFRQTLHEWFVVYNPLYFASALCFLVGVWLGSGELAPLDWRLGDLALLGIVQLYELALIGGAWLLWRAGAKRPATILPVAAAPCFVVLRLRHRAEREPLRRHAGGRVAFPATWEAIPSRRCSAPGSLFSTIVFGDRQPRKSGGGDHFDRGGVPADGRWAGDQSQILGSSELWRAAGNWRSRGPVNVPGAGNDRWHRAGKLPGTG